MKVKRCSSLLVAVCAKCSHSERYYCIKETKKGSLIAKVTNWTVRWFAYMPTPHSNSSLIVLNSYYFFLFISYYSHSIISLENYLQRKFMLQQKFHGLHTILIWHHCLYNTVVQIVSRYIYFVIPVGRNVTSVGENNHLAF